MLKASYKNSHEQATSLSRFGYNRDEELSNDNQQAYFNPEKKKLIYTVTGTQNRNSRLLGHVNFDGQKYRFVAITARTVRFSSYIHTFSTRLDV